MKVKQFSSQVKAGTLTSPKFPNDYPNYVDEYTTLTADEGEVIELRFDMIDIEGENPECKYDSVSVYDTNGGQLCKLCGRSTQSRPVGLPTPQHEVLWWRSCRRQECQNARMPSNPMDLSKSSGFASISSMDPRVYKSQMQTISQQ